MADLHELFLDKVLLFLFVLFIFALVFFLYVIFSLQPVYRACSSGWSPVCISSKSRDDLIVKDGCLIDRNRPSEARLCGEYKIFKGYAL